MPTRRSAVFSRFPLNQVRRTCGHLAHTRLGRLFSILALSIICLLPSPGQAQLILSDPNFSPAPPGLERLARVQDKIRELRAALDRTQFDPEALLESLDYDPEQIIEFVRDKVRFEPYAGLLRGTLGTMMSRGGNSLDQSLLLASLLNDAGADARIMHARLNTEQARQLVQSLHQQTRPPRLTAGEPEALRSAFKEVFKVVSNNETTTRKLLELAETFVPARDTPAWHDMQQGADYLASHLDKAGLALAPVDIEAALIEQSRDYFWVQYKDGLSQPWKNIHPIRAGDSLEDTGLEAREILADSIPAHFQHRLRISLKLERTVAGQQETVPLMQDWERPVANIVGKRLTLALHPDGSNSLADLNDLAALAENTSFLIPIFNGSPATGAQAFDLRGRTISMENLSMDAFGAADVFKTASDKTLDAAEALASLSISGKPAETPVIQALNRVWVEYVSIHPDGGERVDSRTIWDAHDHQGELTDALWPLMMAHGIGVIASDLAPAWMLDRELARLQAIEPMMRWAITSHWGQDNSPPPRPKRDWEAGTEFEYIAHFDHGIPDDLPTHLVYRAEPSLIVLREGMRPGDASTTLLADVDVIHNRRAIIQTGQLPLQTDPAVALRLGIWETQAENLALAHRHPAANPDTLHSPTFMYLDPAAREHPPRLLQAASAPLNEALPDTALAAITEDLERGYVVALNTAPGGPGQAMWWRIHPATGETLGRGLDGRGSAVAEYTVLQEVSITALLATLGGIGTFANCMANSATNHCSALECLTTAIFVSGAGAGLGVGLGYTLATGTIAVAAISTATGSAWNLFSNASGLVNSCLTRSPA